MKIQRLFLGAFIALGLLLSTGCTMVETATSGTALYAFDATNKQILVWDDVATLYDATSTAPTRTLTSTYLTDVSPLAWGGMCLDRSGGRLWLVSETGKVARIDSIRSRSGAIGSGYIRTFQLSSDDRLDSGTFGQMAIDISTGALYVTEYNTSDSRIWVINSPAGYAQGATVPFARVPDSGNGDTYGYGVAVGSSSRLFGYFNSGSTITHSGTDYSGPRLMLGTASGFTKVIVGESASALTELGKYGVLAADSTNNLIYVSKHITDLASTSYPPIAVFKTNQFASTYNNVAPHTTLGDADDSSMKSIRLIAHPGNKDWLVGANSSGTGSEATGSNVLLLWKSPSTDTSTAPTVLTYGSMNVRGIALDGSATSN